MQNSKFHSHVVLHVLLFYTNTKIHTSNLISRISHVARLSVTQFYSVCEKFLHMVNTHAHLCIVSWPIALYSDM